jgi:multidrug efflux pump subunit AcrA (membrane-fusion protein)
MKVILPRGTTQTVGVALTVLTVVVVIYSIALHAGVAAHSDHPKLVPLTGQTSNTPVIIALACPGRIEGRSDVLNVGAATDGLVRAVHVKEGQTVHQGDILAELDCRDLQPAVRVAMGNRDALKEARTRMQRGSRQEEREAATQKTDAALAIREQASTQLARMSKLYQAAGRVEAYIRRSPARSGRRRSAV